ncbi:MAG: SOS response-associated peptidase family protein [Ginsengibacter sp.]
MCNYMGHRVSKEDFIRLKQLEKQAKVIEMPKPYQTGFDYLNWPVVRPIGGGDFEVDIMEWGFVPANVRSREGVDRFRKGYKDYTGKFRPPFTTLNAKGEELLLPGKMFRESALNQRCLVIASYFYEWRHEQAIGKRGEVLKTPAKYPYYIGVKGSPKYFFMAGVWSRFEDKSTHELVDTFAVCTTEANSLMAQIHNSKMRMPTILNEDLAAEWISEGLSEQRITQLATHQIKSEEMEYWNIPKNFKDLPDPTIKFCYEGLSEIAA